MSTQLNRGVILTVAAVGLAGAMTWFGSIPTAQGGISVTFPVRVAAGPDYATEVLGDPWDMCNWQDISPDPAQLVGWSTFNFYAGPCRAGGTTSLYLGYPDASVMMLSPGIWNYALNPGKNGRNFPIDSIKYQILSYKLYSGDSEVPEIIWMHNPTSHPSGSDLGARAAPQVFPGTQIGVADLTQWLAPGFSPWTNGVVRGLRFDPNSDTPVENAFLYWMRLTPPNSSPLAVSQNITWTGGTATSISVSDHIDGTAYAVAANVSSPFRWYYGFLPPGGYTVWVRNASGAVGSATFSINSPPSIQVTDPSVTSGLDYATTVLGNAWDMSSAADIQTTGSEHFVNLSFSSGMLHATNVTNDPNVTLLYNTNNSVPIDTSRFRYLTYRFQVDGAYDLGAGSVARIYWTSQANMGATTATVSQDILVWPGMNTYSIDLAPLSAAADGGLEPIGAAEPWTVGPKRQLRFDPHEFQAARTFHIDDVKLTAKPAAGASFIIRFQGADPDGDAATVSLYYDTDTNPNNGKTLIGSGIPQSAGQFNWNTALVPSGEYFIYAEARDAYEITGRYSNVPIVVATPPSVPLGIRFVGP